MKREPVVLVVEDHPDTSQVVALLLGMEGIRVVTAADGVEGLEKCRSDKPDLIISDLMMPGLNGFAMIKSLREDSDCGNVPVIVYTAYAQQLAADAIEAGAYGVLSKTDAVDLLVGMVKGLLHDIGKPRSRASTKESK
jgi:two-component system chemotaxis response regulator CheY